jgi:NAD(P)-dependent dehydrogenase (short-subunit alcohol dehydrogenase family)
MNLDLKGKIIIVTGGAKGIGAGITKALAAEGAIPVVVGRDANDNDAIIKEVGAGFGITAELTHPKHAKMRLRQLIEKFGRIDGLVNNAGVNDGCRIGKRKL